jgi:hypothetical protein
LFREKDGYAWRCPICRTFKSIHSGSFFENIRFHFMKILKIIYNFTCEISQTQTAKEFCIARASVVDFYQRLRYVCGKYINPDEIVLGGASKIVEIDESMFARVKHNRGKDLKRKLVWVFGMKERDSGKCYMELVSTRNAASLIPIIYKHVANDTIIHSDLWRSYRAISLVT